MERDSKGLGIVIKVDKVRTSDTLLSVLTPDRGILKVYSYGSRKSVKSIKAPLYTEGNFSIYQKGENGAYSLKDIDVLSTHDGLYSSLENLTFSSLFSEIIIKSQDLDARSYELFVSSLDGLESYRAKLVGSVFILKYLKLAGLSGDWRHCPLCLREYRFDEILGFSSLDRVAVCSDCDNMDMTNRLPMNARLFCARVLELDIRDSLKLGISDEQINRIFKYLVKTLKLAFPATINTIESGLLI